MARAHIVQPAKMHRENTWSSATSLGSGRATKPLPQTRMLWLVSNFLTRRNDAPDPVGWNIAMVEYIPTVREAVYDHPRVRKKQGRPCSQNPRAMREWERRNVERTLLGELSRYYRLDESKPKGKYLATWTHEPLLREGKHKYDHSSH